MMSLELCFQKKYPRTANKILSYWQQANGFMPDFADVSKSSLNAFVELLCEKVAPSSARTYCAQMKSVLNLYADDGVLPKGWEKFLTVKNDVSEQIYLTDDELKSVIEYTPESINEATVQQQFVLSALLGARHGDILRLTVNNIRDGYVCYVSEKTHIKAQVPLSQVAARILRGKYNHGLEGEEKAYLRKVSDPTYNDILRRICKKVGITEEITLYKRGDVITAPKWTFASSHLGRRTCATLLYLHGCDIYTISRILAHASVEMTASKYIMCPIRTLSQETMQYFGQFK